MRNILAITIAALTLGVALVGCGKGHDWNTVSDDHPALETARQQARDSYSEFLSELKSMRGTDLATVEVHYDNSEYIALQVLDANETQVVGIVDSYPRKVSLQKGERVTIDLGDMSVLSDWAIYKEDGSVLGNVVADERVRLRGG